MDGFFGVGEEGVVALGLGKLDKLDLVGEVFFEGADAADLSVEARALLEEFLRALLVLPEGWVLGEGVQFIEPVDRAVPVKDASSAG